MDYWTQKAFQDKIDEHRKFVLQFYPEAGYFMGNIRTDRHAVTMFESRVLAECVAYRGIISEEYNWRMAREKVSELILKKLES